MLIELDPTSSAPLHERIALAVRRAIADGQLQPGERLPAAADLADTIGVNVNTVLRAYRQLRDDGLVDLRRGRGATVTTQSVDRGRMLSALDRLVDEARRAGVGRDELLRLVAERGTG